MRQRRARTIGCLAGLCLAFGAAREDAGVALATESDALYAYRAARVETGQGKALAPGIVVVRGSKIEAVLPSDGKVPAGAKSIDLGDAVVVPGFVNPLSSISDSSARGSVADESGGQPADARTRNAAESLSLEAEIHRRLGRTPYAAYGWLPAQEGLFPGQAAVVRPATGGEKIAKDLVLREGSFLLMNFGLGERWRDGARGALSKAAEVVVKEREEAKKKADAKPEEKEAEGDEKKDAGGGGGRGGGGGDRPAPGGNEGAPPERTASSRRAEPEKPAPPDPLVEVMRGKLRLVLRLGSPAIMDHFFAIYDGLAIKPRLTLVLEPLAPELVARLAERKEQIDAVIVDPRISSLWETTIAVNSVRLLLEHGFEVALVPGRDDLEGLRRVPFRMAQLIKGGVDPEQALAGVTRVPARILGVEGEVGALAPGASASFTVFSDDPLSGTARLLRVFVAGQEVFFDHAGTGELCGEAVR